MLFSNGRTIALKQSEFLLLLNSVLVEFSWSFKSFCGLKKGGVFSLSLSSSSGHSAKLPRGQITLVRARG